MKISFSSNKKNDAAIENNIRVPYAAAKRIVPKARWFLILVLVCSPFVILSVKLLMNWIFVTSPGTIWLEKKTINAIEAGTVGKIFYRRGDTVSPDTVMFHVKRKIPESRIEQIAFLEAELSAVNAGIENGSAFSVAPVMRDGGISRQLAYQNIAYYEQERNNIKQLMEQGAATHAEMSLAEQRLREAKATLALATSSTVTPLVNPLRVAQIEQSIKSLKNMTEEFFNIKSGQGGKVNSILVSEGQSFSAGEPLAVLMSAEQVYIAAYVDPNDFKKIKIGTVAKVKIFGTGRTINAVVDQPPIAADNVPSGISEKNYAINLRGVQLFLRVIDPLQEEETIEGLPVEVNW